MDMDMDINKIVTVYRPILIKYLQTKRTLEDAKCFYDRYKGEILEDKELLDIFMVMVVGDSNPFTKELQDIGKRVTIGLLTYPKINFRLDEVIETFKKEIMAVVKENMGVDLSQIINSTCRERDNRYWDRILEDMDSMGYYDDFIKNLLAVREELLVHLDKSGYTKDAVTDAFDVEFIKQLLYNRCYRSIGIYNFVREVILDILHPILKKPFIELCDNFIKSLGIVGEDTSNTTSISLLQFIINNMIDFLYFDVSEY
jgi:hypothetical protein